MAFREHIGALEDRGDLLTVDAPFPESGDPVAVAAEAARANGPAVLFSDVPGRGRLAAGVRGGPDRMARRDRLPWRRVAVGLGLPADADYGTMLERLTERPADEPAVPTAPAAASDRDRDATALCLPAGADGGRPTITAGVVAATVDGAPTWAPVRGEVRGRTRLRLRVPPAVAGAVGDGEGVSVALGVPTAALLAAYVDAAGVQPWRSLAAPAVASALSDGPVPVADAAGGVVPASAEVVLEGTATPADAGADADATPAPDTDADAPDVGATAGWEAIVGDRPVDVAVERVATRDDPVVPFAPPGAPLAADVHLACLVEGARLHARVSGYWGVSPVSWVGLPVETGLGICLVSSEILYAGFEWQLANTLFSFGRSFDKVIVLDADAAFEDLADALDDMWVKAHPSHDWVFSEDTAPAATAPAYRRDGATGARLYVDAAWDPRWDEGYIAPAVGFESSYPESLRDAVRERWTEMGFDDAGG